MRTIEWREIAEAIGVAAIVASLVFVGLRIRQEDDIARLELVDQSTEQQHDRSSFRPAPNFLERAIPGIRISTNG